MKADSLEFVQSINFGRIILDPNGDLIEIDASSGQAISRVHDNGRSVIVENGHSGKISYKCQVPGETITMQFQERVTPKENNAIHYINNFSPLSTSTPVSCMENETTDLHIGGQLHAEKGQPDKNYEFEISIIIQINNP